MNWLFVISAVLMLSLGLSAMAQEFPEPAAPLSREKSAATNVRTRELQSNCYHCVAQATEDRNGAGFTEDHLAIQKRAEAILRGEEFKGKGLEGTN